MNDQIANIFILFLYVLIFAIIIRSLLTWFPVDRNNEMVRLLNTITEPLLEPVRRVMPRTGMIDFSAMVVIVVLYVMISVVRRAAGQ
ncbi:MAG: YggT family protein [Chloroflexi bacterium]|nr:YggT family protein [Dehalococcoidia bacterium]MCO5201800.1 YggT family protein [Chloroflexota bacterium]MCZ7578490.1 YggT family protein [Dehalococcoidia bacterium]NJD63777.1 YggT family protein [Chloroflexota bacterium]PWB45106.1 MAG: YggT family protein [Dehalococcoidia bacterium]